MKKINFVQQQNIINLILIQNLYIACQANIFQANLNRKYLAFFF
jgi:hypothetical protein